MENPSENQVYKTKSLLSISSLLVGVLSILPYLYLLLDRLIPDNYWNLPSATIVWHIGNIAGVIVEAMPYPVFLTGGIFLGLLGLFVGAKAIKTENRYRVIANLGRIFSSVGIAANIYWMPLFILQ